MKTFKIKYNTEHVINKSVEIKAENRYEALTKFHMQHIEATEVIKIEEVE